MAPIHGRGSCSFLAALVASGRVWSRRNPHRATHVRNLLQRNIFKVAAEVGLCLLAPQSGQQVFSCVLVPLGGRVESMHARAGQSVMLPDGSRVSFAEAGDPAGQVVLYLHGTPGSRMQVVGPVDTAAGELGLRIVAPDRPGYGGSSFARYQVCDYPAMIARFADALGIGQFGVVGTSGGGRYAYACGLSLPDRVRRVSLVASTAPPDMPGVRETWSKADRRLYSMAAEAPWLLRVLMARTARKLRRDPELMMGMLRGLSEPDQVAVSRVEVQSLIRRMTAEAFHQGARGFVHDLRLEALPWGFTLQTLASPIDIWHGLDDTIVQCEQAGILASAVPGSQRHFIAGEGHFSLVMVNPARYLAPFGQSRAGRSPGPHRLTQ
jgi:pimeloyl-ACP methyl ester carboxylesterase